MSVVFWISFPSTRRVARAANRNRSRDCNVSIPLFRSKAFPRGEQTCRLSDRERSPLERRREPQHVLSTFTRLQKQTLPYIALRRNSFLFSSQIFFKNIISLPSSTSTKNNSAVTPNRRKILCTKDFAHQLYYCILYVPRVRNDFYGETMRSGFAVGGEIEARVPWKFGICHSLGGNRSLLYTLESATKLKKDPPIISLTSWSFGFAFLLIRRGL